MILGILSDTHGQVRRTAAALRLLRRAGAEGLVHCGDVGGEAVLEQLAGWRAWLVWGNVDSPEPARPRYAESLGLTVGDQVPLRLRLDGRTIAVFHGDERPLSRLEMFARTRDPRLLTGWLRECDYVLHGHTHVPGDLRIGPLRAINPGALHRASDYTVATLDLRNDDLRFWRVLEDAAPDAEPSAYRLPELRT